MLNDGTGLAMLPCRSTTFAHDRTGADGTEGCHKVRRFLFDCLALMGFGRAGERVRGTKGACSRNLEVSCGATDGGERGGREEGNPRRRVEDDNENSTEDQGRNEGKVPRDKVGLAGRK